jgi:hypothetical protein
MAKKPKPTLSTPAHKVAFVASIIAKVCTQDAHRVAHTLQSHMRNRGLDRRTWNKLALIPVRHGVTSAWPANINLLALA